VGDGPYHIALAADMDAVDVGGRAVHSCGHSIQVAVMLAAISVLNEMGIAAEHGAKVSFIGTPAEEFIDMDFRSALIAEGKIRHPSGKQNMISAGVFDDIDCIISAHISGDTDNRFDTASTLTGFCAKKVTFHGKAAHAGAAPHLGQNALHAAALFLSALSFLHEQFPRDDGVRIHAVIKNNEENSMSVNVIPETVVVEALVRSEARESLFRAASKFDTCAKSCAQALGMTADVETRRGYLPFKQNEALSEIVYHNMLDICGEKEIVRGKHSGASGDIGDLGFLLPSVQFGFSGTGGRIHSDVFSIDEREHVYIDTALVTLNMVIDLITRPELRVSNPNYQNDKAFYLKEWLLE
jgi:amidohydrolase